MSGTTTLEFWQLLVLTFGTAIITALVSIFSPRLVEGARQKAEKKKYQAQKFEEFISALYEHRHWLDLTRRKYILRKDDDLIVSPLYKAIAIATAYFPEFEDNIRIIDYSSSVYILRAMETREKDITDEQYVDVADEIVKDRAEYLKGFDALLEKVREFAKREFQ